MILNAMGLALRYIALPTQEALLLEYQSMLETPTKFVESLPSLLPVGLPMTLS